MSTEDVKGNQEDASGRRRRRHPGDVNDRGKRGRDQDYDPAAVDIFAAVHGEKHRRDEEREEEKRENGRRRVGPAAHLHSLTNATGKRERDDLDGLSDRFKSIRVSKPGTTFDGDRSSISSVRNVVDTLDAMTKSTSRNEQKRYAKYLQDIMEYSADPGQLIEQLAEPFQMGRGAPVYLLHYFAQRGGFDAVKFLVAHGSEINKEDEDGNTPMHYAAYNQDLKMMQFLGNNGGVTWIKNKEDKDAREVLLASFDHKERSRGLEIVQSSRNKVRRHAIATMPE